MTTTAGDREGVEVRGALPGESEHMLDVEAQRVLGISGEEFRNKWIAGDYNDQRSSRKVMRVAMFLPLGR